MAARFGRYPADAREAPAHVRIIAMAVRRLHPTAPFDLRRTLAPLWRGPGDRTMRFVTGGVIRATRTADGPATMSIGFAAGSILAEAWGPGADRAIDRLPGLLGLETPPPSLLSGHPTVVDLSRRYPGIGIPRSRAVIEALVPAILEQKVIGVEARRAFSGLVRRYGEPAP